MANENLNVDRSGLDFIAKWEGCVLKVYKDVAGLPTIGVGHLITKAEASKYPMGTTITKDEAYDLLRVDVQKCVDAVRKHVSVELNQNQANALISFLFNVGTGWIMKGSVAEAVNSSSFSDVPAALMKFSKAKINGVLSDVPGLVARRKAEGDLFLRDVSGSADNAPSDDVDAGSVASVQRALIRLGYDLGGSGADGAAGTKTKAAIRDFQGKSGLTADGVVGPKTVEALRAALKKA